MVTFMFYFKTILVQIIFIFVYFSMNNNVIDIQGCSDNQPIYFEIGTCLGDGGKISLYWYISKNYLNSSHWMRFSFSETNGKNDN